MTLGLETVVKTERTVVTGKLGPTKAMEAAESGLEWKNLGLLEEGHLADLCVAKPLVPLLEKVKARYHEVARLLATGLSGAEVCRRLKMERSQLDMLQEVPSFRMVLAQHQVSRDQSFQDLRRQINLVAEDALAATHAKVLDGSFAGKELVRVTMELLEMDGYAKVQKHIVAFTANDAVMRAKVAAQEANSDRVLRNVSPAFGPAGGGTLQLSVDEDAA